MIKKSHLLLRLINISCILNGIAGTVFFAGPALLASVWFPPNQRATATAIGSFFNYAGVAAGFIIGKIYWSKFRHHNLTIEVHAFVKENIVCIFFFLLLFFFFFFFFFNYLSNLLNWLSPKIKRRLSR